ncbi:APC family permease [Weissella tructae]|jgi:APA family basic amino acid/polyamine antiporter|uniref:APC family amino acid-polyamine-organocation transporter n=2 Tax=Weissella TaxID=46255 RepID=A0A075U0V1_9LACO|nr:MULTISPECIES: amino acid permease [Weissella]AIG66146.1 APC family amino acid-polyamine-organocation transporter [Weissella tructae]AIM63528.1 APC family amino acid-polyamine-organocation transporter [Weissella ceti]AIM64863.1 APC family amino acid-polyamine-organocation transporter [Weissella ceti]ELA07520.1 Amino acid transport protein [Weissella ceti NC36]QVV91296.1 amino acid permease [Weissella tructae]
MAGTVWQNMRRQASPSNYEDKDQQLIPTLRTKDLIAMGVGAVVGAGIFTIPGIVAADYAGPAVVISFIIAAVVAGLSALAYSEFASAMPFAGSIYSWSNVIFGEFVGWLIGWIVLSEYVIALALLASGWSAYFQGFIGGLGVDMPTALSGSFNLANGQYVDLLSAIALIGTCMLIVRGMKGVAIVENALVIMKVGVILLFIVVGATAIQVSNWVPFIPAHEVGTQFGGMQGIFHGASQVFFAYIGFDTIASNSAETVDAQKTMPKAIIGTLVVATLLFVAVAAVLTGMFPYQDYAGNAEPAAWALRQAGHYFTANILSVVALVGMFTGIIAFMIGGSRLLYSFARDGLLPKFIANLDGKGLPLTATLVLTVIAIVLSSAMPVELLANLVSAGTLVAFGSASLGILFLRKRKDIDHSGYKVPLYPILPAISVLCCLGLFVSLSPKSMLLTAGWISLGAIFYFAYGMKHSAQNKD